MIEVRLFAGLRQGRHTFYFMEQKPAVKDGDIVSLFPTVEGG